MKFFTKSRGLVHMRALTSIAAFAAWIYSWLLVRAVRTEFQVLQLGRIPVWLLVLLGATSTALIGTAVSIWLRTKWWPMVSTLAGALLFASIVISQYAVIDAKFTGDQGTTQINQDRPTLSSAFASTLRTKVGGEARSAVNLAIFVAGIPFLLFLSGLAGMLFGFRDRPRPQEAFNA
ncbi:MAG: hypothetical protein ABIS18_01230 [Actinomycetota bacterium]